MTEDILEPELPIIDPHHHLWDLRVREGGGVVFAGKQTRWHEYVSSVGPCTRGYYAAPMQA